MLQIGDAITIEYVNENKEVKTAKSKILENNNDDICINYPADKETGRTIYLNQQTEITVFFFDENQIPYKCKSEVIGKRKEDIPMIVISIPPKEKMIRLQRREYLRVDTMIKATIMQTDEEPFDTFIVNISAGGVAISVPEGVSLKDYGEVATEFELPLKEPVKIKAVAEMNRLYQDEQSGKTRAIMEFSEITNDHQQHIMKYCFQQQLLTRVKKA
ncbi:flagellar brake domain-containing protein [Bacillus safensis]|uniref:flagellar brake protein n=1 Tax=Bacillus TaxID=1386 RepID=UPI0007DBFDA7|nr:MULTISPECIES: flagellar brake domain-containing protein [Bacillus]MBW4849888.1 flagellar brake domain-containing protein [Bacillaceae bacterium]MBW4852498.1 flagellar brake domain-containing protein [Bacillaceae bacterium]MBW4856738.1 flagellar brake domain-containing protein [Bacillaceae bacterium]MCY7582262.1 flagellar brake domain-containing protein [Bacillus safensis]MCY7588621.1 flagellar brake domain-containing protein [Bacillus safensis]